MRTMLVKFLMAIVSLLQNKGVVQDAPAIPQPVPATMDDTADWVRKHIVVRMYSMYDHMGNFMWACRPVGGVGTFYIEQGGCYYQREGYYAVVHSELDLHTLPSMSDELYQAIADGLGYSPYL